MRGCLSLLSLIHQRVQQGCQFIISTHSPIILGYPDALIYELSDQGLRTIRYEESDPYLLTRTFLEGPQRFFHHLFPSDDRGG